MAQKNETEVVNGVVQPRFYQVYGDLIESKEVMEPLAIMGVQDLFVASTG